MFDRILVPTDGSTGSAEAMARAISIAGKYDSTIYPVYVVDTRAGYDGASADIVDALRAAGEESVATAVDRAREAGVEADGDVVSGVPASAILEYIPAHDIDLVVMGTHGRTGFEHFLLGSVAEKVVRRADVPVLTVPISDPE